MHFGGVLPKPRCHHMFSFFDGHTVHVVNSLADLIIPPAMRLACEGEIVVGEIQSFWDHKVLSVDHFGQIWHHRSRCRRIQIPFAHHYPAHIFHHHVVVLVHAPSAHIDNAGFPIGILLNPDDFADRAQRIAFVDRLEPTPLGISEIGHRVQRHIGNRLAKHNMKRCQVIQWRFWKTRRAGKFIRRIERMACGIERMIQRSFATRHCAWHGVINHVTHRIIFEKSPGVGLGH